VREELAEQTRALQELQVTLNIVRRNSLHDEKDIWVPFAEQYLDVARAPNSPEARSSS
jgi:hypothetical protein